MSAAFQTHSRSLDGGGDVHPRPRSNGGLTAAPSLASSRSSSRLRLALAETLWPAFRAVAADGEEAEALSNAPRGRAAAKRSLS